MLARKRTRSWDVQSKPPEPGLDGKDKHVCSPGINGLLCTMSLEKKDVSCFEGIYIGSGLRGWEKVKLRKFWDRCTVCKEEVLDVSGLVVGCSLESSRISKTW